MLEEILDSDRMAYRLLLEAFITVVHPQLGLNPNYEDLVKLLQKKAKDETWQPSHRLLWVENAR